MCVCCRKWLPSNDKCINLCDKCQNVDVSESGLIYDENIEGSYIHGYKDNDKYLFKHKNMVPEDENKVARFFENLGYHGITIYTQLRQDSIESLTENVRSLQNKCDMIENSLSSLTGDVDRLHDILLRMMNSVKNSEFIIK